MTSNLPQFRASVERSRQHMRLATEQATLRVGDFGVERIKRRLPPGASSTAGMPNPFPGYAATGRTKNNFVRLNMGWAGQRFQVSVQLKDGLGRLDRIKAYVHERGMVIHAKIQPYLHFRIQGRGIEDRWVRVKSVTIKKKGYFRAAHAETKALGRALLRQFIGAFQ